MNLKIKRRLFKAGVYSGVATGLTVELTRRVLQKQALTYVNSVRVARGEGRLTKLPQGTRLEGAWNGESERGEDYFDRRSPVGVALNDVGVSWEPEMSLDHDGALGLAACLFSVAHIIGFYPKLDSANSVLECADCHKDFVSDSDWLCRRCRLKERLARGRQKMPLLNRGG